ncbi:MAG: outer membrane beta-barrel protein, partial [Paludibacteraceae bacterium]|nr:outer membrane beta-barrel protein [Paludibacteraceae bacterium]
IQMKEDTQLLSEVVVKGQLPKTHAKGDAMRTTVAGTILEKAGTVSDALGKIPSIETERGGSVTVLGRGDAEVYINGRKVQDLNELSRLRSDQIQHVDVVQNPGARYKASTKAVVRITLKKAQGEGFSFQDYFSGIYQYGHTLTNNLDVNYRTGGLDITASLWAGRYGHAKSLQEHELTYFVGPDYIQSNNSQESKSIWKGYSPQLQLNYMVDENHSFGAFYKYDRHPSSDFNSMFFTDNYVNGKYTEHSESRIWQDESFSKHIFNAYYNGKVGNLGIDLNIDGLFDDTKTPGSTTEQTAPASGDTTAPRTIESNTLSGNNFWATKLILSYPVWKGNLSLGGEYSYNHRTDAYSFMASDYVPVKTTDTEINEKSSAAFLEYGRSFGKVYAQVGLRYEHLTNDYFNFGKKEDEVCRDYGDWFPTAVISAPVGKAQLSLSYRRDIERPNYANLTSSTVYVNRYTYQSGNPYLLPTYTHSLVLNAAYKWANLMLNYGRVKDALTMSTEPF